MSASEPLRNVIRYIVEKHHRYVRRETARIVALLTRVGVEYGATRPEIALIEQLFLAMGQELGTHMLKEEQVLFPHIERMERSVEGGEAAPAAFFGPMKRPVANMVADHDDADALMAEIRTLSNGFQVPCGACASITTLYRALEEFERDLEQHVRLENDVLFPRAVEMERAGSAEVLV